MPAVSLPIADVEGDLRRFVGRAMASPLRLTLSGDVPDGVAEWAWAAVQDEFEACEQAMSRFREQSGLTILNRAALEGRATAVDPRLRRALVAADRAHRTSGGAFDPRVLGDLERLGYRGAALPGRAAGAAAVVAANGRVAEDRIVSLDRDGTLRIAGPVDLGGIGKGLALRWAADRVGRLLPPGGGALVEAGGDLAATGPGPDGGSWPIGIEHPAGGEDLAVVALRYGALATSSTRINRWVAADGTVTHHLLDPRTGDPGGDGLVAVTVAGPDPAWAEVRTKQLFLAGARRIGALARKLGLAAWWVRDDVTLEMTPAARAMTAWVSSEAPRS